MALRPFVKLQNLEYNLSRVQENMASFVRQLLIPPFLQGVEKIDVSLGTTEVSVEHTLGRAYRGWIITNIDTNTNVWVSSTTNSTKFLKLTAGATCTVSLWIY